MIKTKLFSLAFLTCGLASLIAPVITSCGNKSITPVIEQETKDQFQEIKSDCCLNKQSTITFVPKQDQELDSSSVELRINGKKLESIKDYKVVDNTITIYYYAMTSTNVNVKADAKNQHVFDKFSYEFINEPICVNDTISANDIKVSLCYKDGTKETLSYSNKDYKIYQIKYVSKQEYKYELNNFDTTPFIFDSTGTYIFELQYINKTNIDPIRFECKIQTMNYQIFFSKYSKALTNYYSSIDKYGWMTFDTPATIQGLDIYSALIKYENTDEKHCVAEFRKGTVSTVSTGIVGGKTVTEIDQIMDQYGVQTFENYSDSFGFKTIADTSGHYAYLRFNKQGYIVDWINTYDVGVETTITNAKYIDYAKTAKVNTNIPTEVNTLIENMEIYDPIDPSKKKAYINENDNKFMVRTTPKDALGSNIAYGRYCIYIDDGTKIFTSDVIELSKPTSTTVVDTVIEVSDWKSITHGSKIVVQFEAIKYATVQLSTTHTYTNDHVDTFTWKDAKSKYAYDGKAGGVEFSFTTKAAAESKVGSWYLSLVDNDITPGNLVCKGAVKDYGTGGSVSLADINWSSISVVPEGQVLYLMFGEPLTATLNSSDSITNNFDNVSYGHFLTETEGGTQIQITLTPKSNSNKGRFVIKNTTGTEIDVETIDNLVAGEEKTFTFNFDKWLTVQTGDTLTLEYKRWTTINIQHREKPLTWTVWGLKGEPHWPELAIWDYDYFTFTGAEATMPHSTQKSFVMSNWKRKKDYCSGEYCLAGIVGFAFNDNGSIRLDVFNLSGTNAPNDGDIYTFNITFKIETEEYFGEFVFNDCELQYVHKDHD